MYVAHLHITKIKTNDANFLPFPFFLASTIRKKVGDKN